MVDSKLPLVTSTLIHSASSYNDHSKVPPPELVTVNVLEVSVSPKSIAVLSTSKTGGGIIMVTSISALPSFEVIVIVPVISPLVSTFDLSTS
jgi:hypothetical protein